MLQFGVRSSATSLFLVLPGLAERRMKMILKYWEFITRQLPEHATPTAMDVIPDFYRWTVIWSLFFTVLHLAFPLLARTFFPKWFSSLSNRDQKDAGSYVVCTIHHLAMVPLAWLHVYNDAQLTTAQALSVIYPVVEASVAPFVIGYLVGDTLGYALPEMLDLRFEFIIHHFLTLYLIITSLTGPGYFCRFIPHLIICDTANIFFNIAWILRRCGYKHSVVVLALEMLFSVAFLFVRAINLPLVFLQTMRQPGVVEWGLARFTLLPIVLMQWYWFAKILAGMAKKLFPGKARMTDEAVSRRSKSKST